METWAHTNKINADVRLGNRTEATISAVVECHTFESLPVMKSYWIMMSDQASSGRRIVRCFGSGVSGWILSLGLTTLGSSTAIFVLSIGPRHLDHDLASDMHKLVALPPVSLGCPSVLLLCALIDDSGCLAFW